MLNKVVLPRGDEAVYVGAFLGDWRGMGKEVYREVGTTGKEKMKQVPYTVSMKISKGAEGIIRIQTTYKYQAKVRLADGTIYNINDPAGDFDYNALAIDNASLQALSVYNDQDNASQLFENFMIGGSGGTIIQHTYSGTTWDTLFKSKKIGILEGLVNKARGLPANKNRMLVSGTFRLNKK